MNSLGPFWCSFGSFCPSLSLPLASLGSFGLPTFGSLGVLKRPAPRSWQIRDVDVEVATRIAIGDAPVDSSQDPVIPLQENKQSAKPQQTPRDRNLRRPRGLWGSNAPHPWSWDPRSWRQQPRPCRVLPRAQATKLLQEQVLLQRQGRESHQRADCPLIGNKRQGLPHLEQNSRQKRNQTHTISKRTKHNSDLSSLLFATILQNCGASKIKINMCSARADQTRFLRLALLCVALLCIASLRIVGCGPHMLTWFLIVPYYLNGSFEVSISLTGGCGPQCQRVCELTLTYTPFRTCMEHLMTCIYCIHVERLTCNSCCMCNI